MNDLDIKEKALQERAKRLEELEKEIQEKEKALKQKENKRNKLLMLLAIIRRKPLINNGSKHCRTLSFK